MLTDCHGCQDVVYRCFRKCQLAIVVARILNIPQNCNNVHHIGCKNVNCQVVSMLTITVHFYLIVGKMLNIRVMMLFDHHG
jgi:hypothetical protein